MSRENAEIVQRSFAAIARGDVDGLLELYDPAIRFLPLTGTRVESGGYHGHAGVRAYFAEAADVWDELRPYADNVELAGDDVVVSGGCAVRGRVSRVESDTPMAWVITVRDGRIVSHRGYRTADDAFRAAGLLD